MAQYASNRAKYGKTIMFADRWFQCDYLVEALKKRGVRADAVYSRVVSVPGGADVRNRRRMGENAGTLQRFKNNELDVLINVQMLTEGTDVPDAQTVFLTRQTTSHILLKQMVGRALRGPRFGGTEDAYIVAFVDNWRQHIDWAAYDQIEEGAADDARLEYGPRPPLHLISIELVRRLARQMDSGLNIAPWPYTALLPVGWYQVEYDAAAIGTDEGDTGDSSPDTVEHVRNLVMVYQDEQARFDRFLDRLESEELLAFESATLEKSEVENRLTTWRDDLFDRAEDRPGGDVTDNLLDLARHLAQQEKRRPEFFSFEDTRKNHDLDAVARDNIRRDLGSRGVDQLLQAEYTKRNRLWRVFARATTSSSLSTTPASTASCTRNDTVWILTITGRASAGRRHPPSWSRATRRRRKCWYATTTAVCAAGTIPGRCRSITSCPSISVSTTASRTCRRCAASAIATRATRRSSIFRNHHTTLTAAPDGFPDPRMPSGRNAKDSPQWDKYLRRCVNFHYRCAAVERVDLAARGERFRIWRLWLFQGNDPAWLEPQLPVVAARIRQARAEAGFQPAPEQIVIAG